ncbi:MAG TPA: hypothetical protein VIP31_08055 [Acidovorax sp.]
MSDAHKDDLIRRAVSTYPTMLLALLSAMRTHQRNDEPARAGTTPAALSLSIACVLAVRMADDPDALDLAEELFAAALAVQRGEAPPGAGTEKAADVLRRLEDGGVI